MRYQGLSTKKIIIIIVSCIAAVALVVGGIAIATNTRTANAAVDVVQVSMYSTQYWGDESSSGGYVSSDFMQELYPETDKSISELFVKEGDTVKIGDKLLQYDTTRLELNVESTKLEVEKRTYDLQQANKDLLRLRNTKPYVAPTPEPVVPDPTPTAPPVSEAELYSEITIHSKPYQGTGTPEDPYVYLCTEDCVLSKDFLTRLFGLDTLAPTPSPTPSASAEPTPTAPPSEAPSPEPSESSASESSASESSASESSTSESSASESSSSESSSSESSSSESSLPPVDGMLNILNMVGDEDGEEFEIGNGPFVARFEVHEEDNEKLAFLKGWLMDGTAVSGGFFFPQSDDPSGDISMLGLDPDDPSVTPISPEEGMYTADELKAMITQKEQEIRSLEISVKQAKIDASKAELALKNATVTATVSGTVKTLIDLETALFSSSPFLVISGGDGFYVTGTLNESLLGRINVGDSLTAYSYETGGMYTAEIVKISDFPTTNSNYWGGAENPNSSSYEFTAFIPEGDGLRPDTYLEMTLQAAGDDTEQTDTFYLFRAYIRSDDNGKYVLKAGTDGRVHKTYITTGKSIYSDYLEIKSGDLTEADYIAFPYGTDAIDGAKANMPEGADLTEEAIAK